MGISFVIVKKDMKVKGKAEVCPIELKYSYNGDYKRFPTKEFVEVKYWKNGTISNRCPNYTQIQKRINVIRKKIEDIVTEILEDGSLPTPSLVKDNYHRTLDIQINKQPSPKSFWVSFEQFYKEKQKQNRGYYKTILSTKNRLKDFEKANKISVSFDYVLHGRFEYDFKVFCWEIDMKEKKNNNVQSKGLSNNYINKLFSNIKIFLSWCRENRIITEVKKFKSEKIIRNDVLVYLNTDEVTKMYEYKDFDYPIVYDNVEIIKDYDKNSNVIYRNNLELVKDIFTFQCSVGCRWGDIHNMTVGMFKIEKGFFVWTMAKTKANVMVPENSISVGVFAKYSKGKSLKDKLFPKYSQQNFNQHLKQIGKQLSFNRLIKKEILVGGDIREETKTDKYLWELLSSHCGRRSFIKNLIDMGTMDNWSIMKLSGHKTISAFQNYVSVTKDDIKKGKELYTPQLAAKDKKEYFKVLNNIPKDILMKYISEKLD
jgi:integrase